MDIDVVGDPSDAKKHPSEISSQKSKAGNSDSLASILELLSSLKPGYITPTCRENLNSIQTMLNNILKRSIGRNERCRTPKFTPVQESVFVQVLKCGDTQLAKCDWPQLNNLANQEVPKIVPNNKPSRKIPDQASSVSPGNKSSARA